MRGAGGEHEVDHVGRVAVVPRPGLAGDGLLPVADRCADGLEVLVGEGDGLAARFAQPTGLAHGVGRDRAVAHGKGEHLAEDDFGALGR